MQFQEAEHDPEMNDVRACRLVHTRDRGDERGINSPLEASSYERPHPLASRISRIFRTGWLTGLEALMLCTVCLFHVPQHFNIQFKP